MILKENPEKLLLDTVTEYPGRSFTSLMKITELPPNLVHGLLRKLEKDGRVYIDEQPHPEYGNITRKVYPIASEPEKENA